MTFDDLVRKYRHIGILSRKSGAWGFLINLYIHGEWWFVAWGKNEIEVHADADEVLSTWLN